MKYNVGDIVNVDGTYGVITGKRFIRNNLSTLDINELLIGDSINTDKVFTEGFEVIGKFEEPLPKFVKTKTEKDFYTDTDDHFKKWHEHKNNDFNPGDLVSIGLNTYVVIGKGAMFNTYDLIGIDDGDEINVHTNGMTKISYARKEGLLAIENCVMSIRGCGNVILMEFKNTSKVFKKCSVSNNNNIRRAVIDMAESIHGQVMEFKKSYEWYLSVPFDKQKALEKRGFDFGNYRKETITLPTNACDFCLLVNRVFNKFVLSIVVENTIRKVYVKKYPSIWTTNEILKFVTDFVLNHVTELEEMLNV